MWGSYVQGYCHITDRQSRSWSLAIGPRDPRAGVRFLGEGDDSGGGWLLTQLGVDSDVPKLETCIVRLVGKARAQLVLVGSAVCALGLWFSWVWCLVSWRVDLGLGPWWEMLCVDGYLEAL